MIVQVLKQYTQRTEYKVLQKYINVQEINIENIAQGVFLLPGILLSKLEKEQVELLKKWISIPNNQLIITPAFIECNIKDFFDTSLNLAIVKEEGLDYKGTSCQYRIENRVQDKIFKNEKGDFGIHYRKDTGSGLLTIITLPLLDYKLSHKHDEFKQYLLDCIEETKSVKKISEPLSEIFQIKDEHLQLIMLIAAGRKADEDLLKDFKKYFNKEFKYEDVRAVEEDLVQQDVIKERALTVKGRDLVKERRLKPFIKILERGRIVDEW